MQKLGIYIHWPFCRSICNYCDFNRYLMDTVDTDRWISSYISELRYTASLINIDHYIVHSVFFGGGTPTLMCPSITNTIILEIKSLFNVDCNLEITLEANPSSIDALKLSHFKDAGINRISIGVQSINQNHLSFLGRTHSVEDVATTISIAKDYFEQYSIDVMYGYGKQNLQEWKHDLEHIVDMSPNHISAYQLTLEKGTKFQFLSDNQRLLMPDDDEICNMHQLTQTMLQQHNFYRYEVSNYAKNIASESKHNMLYWQVEDYIGIGPGAHGRVTQKNNIRYQTIIEKIPNQWFDCVSNNKHGISTIEPLEEIDQIKEILLMCLRVPRGINIPKLEERLRLKLNWISIAAERSGLIEQYMIQCNNGIIEPTSRGLDFVTSIARRLFTYYDTI